MSDTSATSAPTLSAAQKKHLAAARKLLGGEDPADVRQGLEQLTALGDPLLWSMLAEGSSWDGVGEIVIGPEVARRVRAAHRAWVALHALRHAGGLDALTKMDLRPRAAAWGKSEAPAVLDLAPLAGLTALQELVVGRVADLALLAQLPGLKALRVEADDLAPLAGFGLERLSLGVAPSAGLAPLVALPRLHTLVLSLADGLDLSPLARCTALTTLTLVGPPCDLTPLAACTALTTLTLPQWPPDGPDLAPLAGIASLKALIIPGLIAPEAKRRDDLPFTFEEVRDALPYLKPLERLFAARDEGSLQQALELIHTLGVPALWKFCGDIGLHVRGTVARLDVWSSATKVTCTAALRAARLQGHLDAVERLEVKDVSDLGALDGLLRLRTLRVESDKAVIPRLPVLPALLDLRVKATRVDSIDALRGAPELRSVDIEAEVGDATPLWTLGAAPAPITRVERLLLPTRAARWTGDGAVDLSCLAAAASLRHLTLRGVVPDAALTPLVALPALEELVLKKTTWGERWSVTQIEGLAGCRFLVDLDGDLDPAMDPARAPRALRIELEATSLDGLETLARYTELTALDVRYRGSILRLPKLKTLRRLTLRGDRPSVDIPSPIEEVRLEGCSGNYGSRPSWAWDGIRFLSADLRGYRFGAELNTWCRELACLELHGNPEADKHPRLPATTHTVRLREPPPNLTGLAWLPATVRTLELSESQERMYRTPELGSLAGAESLSQLEVLVVRCTAMLDDLRPLRGLTRLQRLDLSGCAVLTDVTPLADLPNLSELILPARLDPAAVGAIARVVSETVDRGVRSYTLAPRGQERVPTGRVALTFEGLGVVWVDGALVDTPESGRDVVLDLPPGTHELEVKTALGRRLARTRVEVTDGSDLRVTVAPSGAQRLRVGFRWIDLAD